MRKVMFFLVVLLATGLVAGCGGGGGGSSILTVRSSDNKVNVTALPGSFGASTMVLTPEQASDFVPALATTPGTGAFVAAAKFTGDASAFVHPATIKWTLSSALPAGTVVELFKAVRQNDGQDHLTDTGTSATITSDGLSVGATITECANYVLLKQ